jgi:hypothetical protein
LNDLLIPILGQRLRPTTEISNTFESFADYEPMDPLAAAKVDGTSVHLAPRGDSIAIHPNVIHNVFDGAPVGAWQVVKETDRLRVLVAEPRPGFDAAAVGVASGYAWASLPRGRWPRQC